MISSLTYHIKPLYAIGNNATFVKNVFVKRLQTLYDVLIEGDYKRIDCILLTSKYVDETLTKIPKVNLIDNYSSNY